MYAEITSHAALRDKIKENIKKPRRSINDRHK